MTLLIPSVLSIPYKNPCLLFSVDKLNFFHIVLTIYNLITCRLFSVARPARHAKGAFHPTLRAAPGACAGLTLSRTPCDVASRRNSGRSTLRAMSLRDETTVVPHSVRCRSATGPRSYRTPCDVASRRDHGRTALRAMSLRDGTTVVPHFV